MCRNMHKRITSESSASYHNNISMVDANMLREQGREIKLKNKRFSIASNIHRESARSEVSQYTPDTKRNIGIGKQWYVQTELSLPNWNSKNTDVSLINSSARTKRASTRISEIEHLSNSEVISFNKTLWDLATSGAIAPSLFDFLNEGFSMWIKRCLSHEKENNKKLQLEVDHLDTKNVDLKKELDEMQFTITKLEWGETYSIDLLTIVCIENKDLKKQTDESNQYQLKVNWWFYT